MKTAPWFLIFLQVSGVASVTTELPINTTNLKRAEVLTYLMKNYDGKTAPEMATGAAIKNSLGIYINSFSNFAEASMDYHVNMFIRQSWIDQRLAYGNLSTADMITVDPRNQDSIWVPDLFITNEKKATFHHVTVPNRLMRFDRNGLVLYSLRVSVTASCYMDLLTFPMDRQTCGLDFASYGYTMDDLVFAWKEDTPVDNLHEVTLPHFYLSSHAISDCSKTYKTGNFTCIRIEFHLLRQIGYYFIQIYVPSFLIVVLSWVNFWIDIEAVPARISVGLLTVLTMTTQSSSSRQSMPKVSYVKAIDVWMSTCLVFVFAALLEFAVVNVYARKSKPDTAAKDDQVVGSDDVTKTMPPPVKKARGKELARGVDKKSRKLFPLSFLIFNLIYWPLYAIWGLLLKD